MIQRTTPWKLAASRISAAATSANATIHNEFYIAEEVGRDHRIPGANFSRRNQTHDQLSDIFSGVGMGDAAKFVQDDGPLNRETKLGHGRHRTPDQHTR